MRAGINLAGNARVKPFLNATIVHDSPRVWLFAQISPAELGKMLPLICLLLIIIGLKWPVVLGIILMTLHYRYQWKPQFGAKSLIRVTRAL